MAYGYSNRRLSNYALYPASIEAVLNMMNHEVERLSCPVTLCSILSSSLLCAARTSKTRQQAQGAWPICYQAFKISLFACIMLSQVHSRIAIPRLKDVIAMAAQMGHIGEQNSLSKSSHLKLLNKPLKESRGFRVINLDHWNDVEWATDR